MANRLAQETSPYLLQHKDNPVDWHPWGDHALALARELDRPLLVSIGYSACHWCHVMAHESFEDPAIAALMNESFVCVKVDREERPDIDAVCMEACQGMTGHGGWPLNVFLTPDQQPFFAGTYFPPKARPGMPSWGTVLGAVADAWTNRRAEIVAQGARVAQALGASARLTPAEEGLPSSVVSDSVEALRATYDAANGGWGRAPKFPAADVIEFLLAAGEREMAIGSLEAMAAGGIYDQLGGGFARYSVDATWTIPHFEKMLYDNALLARAYLHGWQVGGGERLREVCCETLDWALRELCGPEGGFYSSLDADSEGVEGRFYVWSDEELRSSLAELYEPAVAWLTPAPFEDGGRVLEARGRRPGEPVAQEIRRRLLSVRSRRVRPGLDDKRLTAWNALMLAALADAGAALGRTDYLEAARECAAFLMSDLRDGDGRLLRSWKDGRGRLSAYLEDHAFLLEALLVLYEATFESRWYAAAVQLAEVMLEGYADASSGGFFTTAAGAPVLVSRRKDLEDSPTPSGNSAAALGLLRLARLSGQHRYEEAAIGVMRLHGPLAARHPSAFGHLLQAIAFYLAPAREVAVVGDETAGAGELARVARERFRPFEVLAGGDGGEVPLLRGRGLVDGRAAAYVCEHFACQAPVTDADALSALLAA
jgi:uncharacterized protein YyaL (SSP411 family)